MMSLTIHTTKEIVSRHAEIITNAKKKLIDTTRQKRPLTKSLVTILNDIAAHQSNIIKRAQLITKQKVSFFEDVGGCGCGLEKDTHIHTHSHTPSQLAASISFESFLRFVLYDTQHMHYHIL